MSLTYPRVESPQEFEEWRAWRRYKKVIGASDAAAILGLSPWEAPWSASARFRGKYTKEVGWQADIGRLVEGALIEYMDWDPGAGTFADPELPWAICTPDAIDNLDDGRWLGREVKWTSWRFAEDWKLFEMTGGDPRAVLDTSVGTYWVQVQWTMMVLDRDVWAMDCVAGEEAALRLLHKVEEFDFERDVISTIVERDDAFVERMREAAIAFRERYICGDEWPEAGAKDLRALAEVYREPLKDSEIEADEEALRLHAEILEAKAKAKELKAEEKELKAKIQAYMGDHERLCRGSLLLATWKKNRRGSRTLLIKDA